MLSQQRQFLHRVDYLHPDDLLATTTSIVRSSMSSVTDQFGVTHQTIATQKGF